MKLLIRHTFPCPPEDFWAAFWDPALDDKLQEGTSVGRKLLEDRKEGEIGIQRYRFTPARTLPGFVAKLVGTDKLTYDQENRYDPRTQVLTWKVIPSILPDRVAAKGTFTVRAIPGGCERVVDGNIEVRMPLVGSRVEQAIVPSIEQAYDVAAKVIREFIAARGAQ